MDISSISVQYLNSAYVPLSSSAPTAPGLQSGAGFEELLKKAQRPNVPEGADVTSSSTASKNAPIDKTDRLYGLCQDLETFLIKNLIKSMRSTIQKTNLINTGFAGEMYEDMLYDEYAKSFALNANFGFAEMAYKELTGLR